MSSAAEEWVKWTEPPAGTPLLRDLNDPSSPNNFQRYAFSKLVSIFLARQFAQLPKAAGLVVDVVCPGLCLSELVRHCDDAMRKDLQSKSLPTTEGAKNVSRLLPQATGASLTSCFDTEAVPDAC